jgi:glycosyltransferase involved in cell wall biosynthesis
MPSSPSVAVFMPTMNAANYLVEAINSFRSQTFQDFTFFIYDGGSTDGTIEIVQSVMRQDNRLRLSIIENSTPNQRANLFLQTCQPDIWINAHADDVSIPSRIADQLTVMNTDLSIAVLGAALQFWLHDPIHCNRNFYTGFHTYPETHDEIIVRLPFWWCFATPSVALNAKLFRDHGVLLDEKLQVGGDWDLYWRAGQIGQLRNLPKPLVSARHHGESDGAKNSSAIKIETRIVRDRIANASGLASALSLNQYDNFLTLEVEYDTVSANFFNEETLSLLKNISEKKNEYFSNSQRLALKHLAQCLYHQVETRTIPQNPLVNQWEKMISERDELIANLSQPQSQLKRFIRRLRNTLQL